MVAVDLFDLVDLFETRGVVAATKKNTAYCDCCGTRHVRQWYSVANTGDSFYICMGTGSVMVSTASGHWIQITPIQLVEWLSSSQVLQFNRARP